MVASADGASYGTRRTFSAIGGRVVSEDQRALLEVVRKHTRSAQRQLRTLGSLFGQLADELDEISNQIDAQPRRHSDDTAEAQR